MNTFNRAGANLHFAVSGDDEGPVLVFSNSLGTDFRIWDQVIARLPATLRIVRYDKRGHGLSDVGTGPWGMADHVAPDRKGRVALSEFVSEPALHDCIGHRVDTTATHGFDPLLPHICGTYLCTRVTQDHRLHQIGTLCRQPLSDHSTDRQPTHDRIAHSQVIEQSSQVRNMVSHTPGSRTNIT